MSIEMLNRITASGGFKKDDSIFVLCSEVKKPKSLNIIECEYGNIFRQIFSPEQRYTLTYGIYEVDIDFTENEFDSGYVLKAALYRRDEIINFQTKETQNLREGLIELSENMLSKV